MPRISTKGVSHSGGDLLKAKTFEVDRSDVDVHFDVTQQHRGYKVDGGQQTGDGHDEVLIWKRDDSLYAGGGKGTT